MTEKRFLTIYDVDDYNYVGTFSTLDELRSACKNKYDIGNVCTRYVCCKTYIFNLKTNDLDECQHLCFDEKCNFYNRHLEDILKGEF